VQCVQPCVVRVYLVYLQMGSELERGPCLLYLAALVGAIPTSGMSGTVLLGLGQFPQPATLDIWH